MCIGNVLGGKNYILYRLHGARGMLQENQFDSFVWIKAFFFWSTVFAETKKPWKVSSFCLSPLCNGMVSRLYHRANNLILTGR